MPREGPTTLLTDAAWDLARAESEGYAQRVEHAPKLGNSLATASRESPGRSVRIGIAGYNFFPAPTYFGMAKALPKCAFAEASVVTGRLR